MDKVMQEVINETKKKDIEEIKCEPKNLQMQESEKRIKGNYKDNVFRMIYRDKKEPEFEERMEAEKIREVI